MPHDVLVIAPVEAGRFLDYPDASIAQAHPEVLISALPMEVADTRGERPLRHLLEIVRRLGYTDLRERS
jgi:hypothetical protein